MIFHGLQPCAYKNPGTWIRSLNSYINRKGIKSRRMVVCKPIIQLQLNDGLWCNVDINGTHLLSLLFKERSHRALWSTSPLVAHVNHVFAGLRRSSNFHFQTRFSSRMQEILRSMHLIIKPPLVVYTQAALTLQKPQSPRPVRQRWRCISLTLREKQTTTDCGPSCNKYLSRFLLRRREHCAVRVTFIGLNLKDADVFALIPDPSVYPARQAQRAGR